MLIQLTKITLVLLLVLTGCNTNKNNSSESPVDVPGPSDQAISTWRDQKYSMFIHFGLYSQLGGVWNNEKITEGYSEQIRAHGKISKEDFHVLAKSFNPVNWNPDSVVNLATKAGMKSIVITSKHHDGFAMYHTKYTDFNIVDATPYKRDILKELSVACGKQGVKFGVYFSLIDWDFPDAMPISDNNSDSIPPIHHQYNLNQVEELMTNYGPISEIWFDMGKPTLHQSIELAQMVRKYQPDCLISGRLWNDQGDFAVMGDNASPDFKMGTLWQTPASMFDETWGYRSWQIRNNPKDKSLEKLRTFVQVVSNGGNYLLNIGPMGDGSIVPFEREVLLTIGKWLTQNAESIYEAIASPLPEQAWGVITRKPGKLFLFVVTTPDNGKLVLKGLRSKIKKAYFLSDTSRIAAVQYNGHESTIDITTTKASGLMDVITLEYEGDLDYLPTKSPAMTEGGNFELTAENAIKYHSYSGQDYYSTKPTIIKLEWVINEIPDQNYTLEFAYPPSLIGKKLRLGVNEKITEVLLENTKKQDQNNFHQLTIGIFDLKSERVNSITIMLADQSNPHKEIDTDALIIHLKKE